MRIAFIVSSALLVAGCDNGRYQIAQSPDPATVWRLDTRTGDIKKCGFISSSELVCAPTAKAGLTPTK